MLEGSEAGLKAAQLELWRHYRCHHYRANAMVVEEVAEPEMLTIQRIARDHNIYIADVRNSHDVRIATDDEKEPKRSVKLDLLDGGWYRTNQEAFPLVHVTRIWNQLDPDGEEEWLFDVDLVASAMVPMPATMSAEQLSEYKPKPATLNDFEELDIVPPAGFEPSPHVVPNTDNVQEPEKEKSAGVSLPQAQIARLALLQKFPHSIATAAVVQVPGGFCVRASVKEPDVRLPRLIVGTQIRYV